jgi:hypothetical protein
MRAIHASILLLLGLSPQLTCGQKTAKGPTPETVETTVCKILKDPYLYNNKIVKVRASIEDSSEYSLLGDGGCDGLWFVFADGSAPPQLVATVSGNGAPGGKNAKGRQTPPIPVRLVRDSNFEELERYLNLNAKAADCANGPAPDLAHLSDCTIYRITATFIGRIDGVSKSVSESHRNRTGSSASDRKGFGNMGLFDAQIVVQSVSNVVATN